MFTIKNLSRARSLDAKLQRRSEILKSAIKIIEKRGFSSLTMDSVAKQCKLSKAALYIYFKSREELLLAILQVDFSLWFDELNHYLKKCQIPFGDKFVDYWISAIKTHPRLATGLLFIYTTLEENISYEFALNWKNFLAQRLRETHYLILSQFEPKVSFDDFVELISLFTGCTMGLWAQSQSELKPSIQKVLETNKDLTFLKVRFEDQMKTSLGALLQAKKFETLRRVKSSS